MDNEFKDVRDLRDLVKPMLEKAAEPVTIRRVIVRPNPGGEPIKVCVFERGPKGELILVEGEDPMQQEKDRQEILHRRFVEDAQDTSGLGFDPGIGPAEPPEPATQHATQPVAPAPKPAPPPPVDPFEANLHEAVAKIGGYRRAQKSVNRR